MEGSAMPIAVVCIPWYQEADYQELRGLLADGDRLHATYYDWLAAAEGFEAHLRATGQSPFRAVIRPRDFLKWCRRNNRRLDARARLEYSNELARRFVTEPVNPLEFGPDVATEFVKARMDILARARRSAARATRHTVAIFALDGESRPEAIGSGVLVRCGETMWLLTAAHVLDQCDTGTYVPELCLDGTPLSGGRLVTVGPPDRRYDKVDVGLIRLSDDEAERAGKDAFLDLDPSLEWADDQEFTTCLAIGFPVRDQSWRPETQELHAAETIFSTGFESEDRYALAGADPETHILISLKRQNILHNFVTRGSPPSLQGISGGGVWPISVKHDDGDDVPLFLAGIVLEQPQRYQGGLLCVRSEVVLALLRRVLQDEPAA
jgi:hypothetical protein